MADIHVFKARCRFAEITESEALKIRFFSRSWIPPPRQNINEKQNNAMR